ncbi:Flp family type IVb pilin [Candidatus Bealeia paramacronuclearis]|uniref:Flp family type IVb pilin n=1 Tax=Candidatus Bealeia paramacronuclearis TaxID=1921001 RepID=UPI002F26B198
MKLVQFCGIIPRITVVLSGIIPRITVVLKLGSKMKILKYFIKNDCGATMIEYGLIMALIAGVCVVAITNLTSSISGLFTTIKGYL